MDIVELLAELEELIEKGIEIPIIKKTFLDKEKLLDIINDISLSIPEEIREAKAINEDREKILSDAQRLADAKIKEAEHKVVSLSLIHIDAADDATSVVRGGGGLG